MARRRSGSTLIEVLVALVLMTLSASWALAATAATERAVGTADVHRGALHRAELALAALQALPCESTAVSHRVREPRWVVSASRTSSGSDREDAAVVVSTRGDTIAVTRHRWCGR